MKGKFKIGCDPEFFFTSAETNTLVSAIPYITGTKEEPAPLPKGGNIQRDNVAVEFGVPPAESGQDFVRHIGDALVDMLEAIPAHLNITALQSAHFPKGELEHPEAKRFGCDPDFCAWELKMTEKPACATTSTFRSCGGHIHVGHVENSGNDFLLNDWGKVWTIRMMDTFHGVISTVLDSDKAAIERRTLYGKAGCHRPTDYGVEYRTLSNYWCKAPQLVMLMYHLTDDVLRLMRDDRHEKIIEEIGPDKIQAIINEGRMDDAKAVISKDLRPLMSKDSVIFYDECLKDIGQYELSKSWKLAR